MVSLLGEEKRGFSGDKESAFSEDEEAATGGLNHGVRALQHGKIQPCLVLLCDLLILLLQRSLYMLLSRFSGSSFRQTSLLCRFCSLLLDGLLLYCFRMLWKVRWG